MQGSTRLIRRGLAIGSGLVFISAVLLAQDANGRVLGTITDPSGAAITSAKVTVINTDTQVPRETVTDKEGSFQILDLPIGTYSVTAEAPGFNKAVTAGQRLLINQSLRIDLSLEVGSTSNTVQVEATASTVETVNATLGQSVTSRPIVNLPLNGRNVLDLALLQPGVTPQNPQNGAAGTFSIAGGRTDSVTFLLDGGLNNNLLDNSIVFNPNPDTVAEFRLLTSNYTAEYGRNGGGIISVVTRSGTNDYHGSFFDYVRNNAFNANSFFSNEQGTPRPVLKRNQFGATAGGPITIPKLIHGRDRMFFFIGYQGQRQVSTTLNGAITTFTPAEAGGDFSLSNPSRSGPDPRVVTFLQKYPFYQPDPVLAARGIIDPNRIHPVAKNYFKNNLIPTAASGRIFAQDGAKDDRDELTEKLDFLVTTSDRISVTLGSRRNPRLSPFTAESNTPGYPVTSMVHNYFGNANYIKVFTPNLLNDFRFTAQRFNQLQNVPARKLPNPTDLGINIISDNPTGPTLLRFGSGLLTGFSRGGPTSLINNTYAYTDNLTWTKGRHSVKGGFLYSPYQNNTVYDFYIDGRFRFSGASGGIGSDNDRADFLFGLPDEYRQFPEAPSNIRSASWAGFVQDEWRVSKNLVLTLGVRYEYNSPKEDTQGRSFSYIPGLQSTRFPNAPRGLVFPGDNGAPKGANFPDKNDWAPRFGFAWDPRGNGRTSVRGGFGVFYDVLKGEDNLQFNGQGPFFGAAFIGFDPPKAITATVPYLTDPFGSSGTPQSFPSRPPASSIDFGKAGFLPFGGSSVYFVDPRLRTPYTYQYNLSLQHEMSAGLVTEISYVGSASHKLTSLVDNNPFIRGTSTRQANVQPGVTAGSFGLLDTFENVGNASYNSLQASLQKRTMDVRFFGTTYFTLAYTYSHNIDSVSGFRENTSKAPYYNHKLFHGNADTDLRHYVSFSGGWDLPFDRWWSNGPKRIIGGWSLYPIVTWRTGFPIDVYAGFGESSTRSGPSGAGDRDIVHADLVGTKVTTFDPKNSRTINGTTGHYYFDPGNFSAARFTSAFEAAVIANPSLATYGTLPRNSFFGPGRTNFDLSLSKKIPIYGERVAAELRGDFFNILNHAEFDIPSRTITSGQFGLVSTTADPRIIQLAVRLTF